MFTLYNTCCNIKKLQGLHSAHTLFYVFVQISEQVANLAVYKIDLLVFVTQTKNVHCAVQTGS